MVFLVNLVFNFYSDIYTTTTFLLVNVYLMQNMKKNPLKYQFLCFFGCFFHNIGPTLAQILPRRLHPLYFFWLIFNEICQGIYTTNINSLCHNPEVLKKKLVKPLKNCFFRPNLHRKEVIMDHAQNVKKIFFGRNNKSRSSALIKFLFYQNIICFD